MSIPQVGFSHQQSNQAELQIMELSDLYEQDRLDHSPERAHRINFFGIIYIEQGTGNHMVDFEEYPFDQGSVLFVQREQVHSFDFSNRPKGKILLFTQAFLDQVHANMKLPNYTPTHLNEKHSPLLQLEAQDQTPTLVFIRQMIEEINREDSEPLIVMYLFSAFALSLHRLRPEIRQDKLTQEQSIRFARFFELMQSHFHQIRDANWYAQQINTTYKTLNIVCKLATGLTAKQMIDAFTIIEIKRRLVVSHTPSQQMAYDFGFEDASNFVKYFKNLTGLTPSQFSQKYRTPVL